MEQEYTTSVFYKVFYSIGALFAVGFTLFLSLSTKGGYQQNHDVLIAPILGIIGAVLTIVN